MNSFATKETPIMLSSHVYWWAFSLLRIPVFNQLCLSRNLEAYQESQDLVHHYTEFKASRIIAADGILIPTGNFTNVKGTPADFHNPQSLGNAIQKTTAGEFCGTGNSNWPYLFCG